MEEHDNPSGTKTSRRARRNNDLDPRRWNMRATIALVPGVPSSLPGFFKAAGRAGSVAPVFESLCTHAGFVGLAIPARIRWLPTPRKA